MPGVTEAVGVFADLRAHWHVYAAMPLTAALIGYLTKVLAVEMMFRPLQFRGIPPVLGWQGVIPRSAERIASVSMDLLMSKLVDAREIVDRIDLDQLRDELEPPLRRFAADMTRAVMPRLMPVAWGVMPEAGRRLVVARVERTIPATLERVVGDLRDDVDGLLDLKALAVDALVRDRSKTVQLVRTVGRNELSFIVRMGAPFGFVIGLIQAATWAATHNPWIMPAFGAVTGSVTDWLALQMIFRPVSPRRYLGVFRWQGLFHGRRREVTEDYARLIADELITPANVLEHLLDGPNSDRFLELVTSEIDRVVDEQAGLIRPWLLVTVGSANYDEVKVAVAAHVVTGMRQSSEPYAATAARAVDLPGFVVEKLEGMTDDEYEGLLRPAFKQDEWKLVATGAVLGFLVGELQLHLLLR